MEGRVIRDPEIPGEHLGVRSAEKPLGIPAYTGQVIASVDTLKYLPFQRGIRWKIIMGTIAALVILFALATQSYIMAVACGVFIWVYITTHREADNIHAPLVFTTVGVYYLEKFYPYTDLKSYYFILAPDMTSLNLHQKKLTQGDVIIYLLNGEHMDDIRRYFGTAVAEETGVEDSFSHKLIRLLQL